jgi:hypothetical protein
VIPHVFKEVRAASLDAMSAMWGFRGRLKNTGTLGIFDATLDQRENRIT